MQQRLEEISVFLPAFTKASSHSCRVSFSGIEIGSGISHDFELPCPNGRESARFVRAAGRGAAYRFAIVEQPRNGHSPYTVQQLEKMTMGTSTVTVVGIGSGQNDLDQMHLDVIFGKKATARAALQSKETIVVAKHLQLSSGENQLVDWSSKKPADQALTISDSRFGIKIGDQIKFNALVELPGQNLWKVCGTATTGFSHAATRVKAAKTLTVRVPSRSQEYAQHLWGTIIDKEYTGERNVAISLSANQQEWLQDQGARYRAPGAALLNLHKLGDDLWTELHTYTLSRVSPQNMDVIRALASRLREGAVLITLVDPKFMGVRNERDFIQYGDAARNRPVYEAAALGLERNLAMYADANARSMYRAAPLPV